jgi:hypothetical protein
MLPIYWWSDRSLDIGLEDLAAIEFCDGRQISVIYPLIELQFQHGSRPGPFQAV